MAIATNQEITNAQVAACLQVVNVVGHARSMFDDEDSGQKAGDHVTSMEATVINACNRLDEILNDESRWRVPETDGHSYVEAIAREQVLAANYANKLKEHEVFAADFSKQLAIARLSNPPEFPPAPTKKNNAKRKKQ